MPASSPAWIRQKPRQAEITLLLCTPNVLNPSFWAPFIVIGDVLLFGR
jgi:hypothetical protein